MEEEKRSYRQVSDEVRQLAQSLDGVSLNGSALFGGKKRRGGKKSGKKSGSKKSGSKRSGVKRSGKKSGKKAGKKSGSRKSKKSMGPSFSEQLITLANALQKTTIAGGKPKRSKKTKKPLFQSLI